MSLELASMIIGGIFSAIGLINFGFLSSKYTSISLIISIAIILVTIFLTIINFNWYYIHVLIVTIPVIVVGIFWGGIPLNLTSLGIVSSEFVLIASLNGILAEQGRGSLLPNISIKGIKREIKEFYDIGIMDREAKKNGGKK